MENGTGLPQRVADLERQVAELSRLVKGLISLVGALTEAPDQTRQLMQSEVAKRAHALWDEAQQTWPEQEEAQE